MTTGIPITDLQRAQILTMRADGHTIAETARAVRLSWTSVHHISPGRVGKVPNDRLREAFLASPVSAADVARSLGWDCGHGADTSRVKRTLGLMGDCNGAGRRSTRRSIDWETGSLIAEAIGVPWWTVLADLDETNPRLDGEVEAA